ncbi:hypothetical protein Nepgr_014777 [Nepenthes gracilis]|uniref:Uncharacterized protein n=1 Tax=Nepenthes gracilis TaxID=150966 RepID=A0AAD3SLU1_NEPGR|nr:hypothetical protein Nepgr_014777 [Nepenthes gracilis]
MSLVLYHHPWHVSGSLEAGTVVHLVPSILFRYFFGVFARLGDYIIMGLGCVRAELLLCSRPSAYKSAFGLGYRYSLALDVDSDSLLCGFKRCCPIGVWLRSLTGAQWFCVAVAMLVFCTFSCRSSRMARMVLVIGIADLKPVAFLSVFLWEPRSGGFKSSSLTGVDFENDDEEICWWIVAISLGFAVILELWYAFWPGALAYSIPISFSLELPFWVASSFR